MIPDLTKSNLWQYRTTYNNTSAA